MMLIIEKLWSLIEAGLDFDTVVAKGIEYANSTHILFCLESMMNLARNGRVSVAAAKIAGVLGIRGVGDVREGQITTVAKPRGGKKAIQTLVEMMKERGFYDGAWLRIAHCLGDEQANALAEAVRAEFPNARIKLEPTTCLCSFYAEAGGLMIGFEGSFNENNHN
jgi:DegV family protein with EDD domain